MSATKNRVRCVFFHGIGGIGMSALAHYYHAQGCIVFGYDRSPAITTAMLEAKGVQIMYTDQESLLPQQFISIPVDEVLVVITPAIPAESSLLSFFKKQSYTIYKRSEALGKICAGGYSVTVAGTHGKTTTSTLLTHILLTAGYHTTAFLGGISNNLESNYVLSTGTQQQESESVLRPYVAEADEFDRSFLTLHPHAGIITSIDPDHLDIYGSASAFAESFQRFVEGHQPRALIVYHESLSGKLNLHNFRGFTYSLSAEADFSAELIEQKGYGQKFKLIGPLASGTVFYLTMPGRHNLENALAASALSLLMGVDVEALGKALSSFKGIHRRFEKVAENKRLVYIDDYAHHPTEISACLSSLRSCYPGRYLTVIFQPHLYSRTAHFMEAFAEALSKCDELVLMDIYPAREKPMPGITSSVLLDLIRLKNKSLKSPEEIKAMAGNFKEGVLVSLGAGDIDQLVEPLRKMIKGEA